MNSKATGVSRGSTVTAVTSIGGRATGFGSSLPQPVAQSVTTARAMARTNGISGKERGEGMRAERKGFTKPSR